ncbi:MAG TPA: PfkB family carbohydrate kinase [Opitutaceae bacterium]|nr:PfkB family carbohydrate kinase [Opitutaceae bacterium]
MIPHLYTLTANLLWETTFTFGAWEAGRTQRAQASSFQVGGKGINVSKMLARLGAPTTAIFFPGGATGAECEQWIRSHGVACQTFPVTVSTRAGLVVRAAGRPETTFLGPDAPLEDAAVRACAEFLDACPADDVLAVCGSVPGWDLEACAPLRAALSRRLARGPVVADTYGPPLAWLSERPLAWAKVNRVEFDTLFSGEERKQPMAERLAASLQRWAVQAWIVTDGPRPVWIAERGRAPVSLPPPAVVEVSATGSGDVLHACLLHAVFHHRQTLYHALELALPYAAANAAHGSVADFPLNNLPDFGSIARR